ncbi:MAG: ArdC family protein, partial [Cyclobacteriaceae bacterium]|nr:ArdC family protein [Cyclobacteriaceae bacterium]
MANFQKKAGKEKAELKDYRKALTDKIIETLENAGKWEKPWFSCNELPYNLCTDSKYRGINVISLMSAGFSSGGFATYNQVSELEKDRQEAQKELITIQAKFQAGELSVTDYENAKAKIEKVFVRLEKKGMVDREKPIHVKKGEKGNPVFKAIQMGSKGKDAQKQLMTVQSKDATTDIEGESKVWVQMVYAGTVFNASQINNINLDRNLEHVPKY